MYSDLATEIYHMCNKPLQNPAMCWMVSLFVCFGLFLWVFFSIFFFFVGLFVCFVLYLLSACLCTRDGIEINPLVTSHICLLKAEEWLAGDVNPRMKYLHSHLLSLFSKALQSSLTRIKPICFETELDSHSFNIFLFSCNLPLVWSLLVIV